ncbi:TonB-dependent receptor [Parafrankia sp. BMG5.11]|uniref:TonB-dependent receptor n=1 Tax=Parafrankia sp. BMG5.11 TaxID=222540 RepID=UPI00103B5935|nr:TonB-dependent receptor [Parafrankia sp. BMG5.11]TCJ37026.1 TonB-dependent receptor [Parafrankia sp. BMG5.11]
MRKIAAKPRRSQRQRWLAGSSLGIALAALHPVAAAAQDQPEQASNGFDAIIVTANRREQENQDVPISITAFSPERLEQQGITKEQDLLASVPSLVVGPNGQGSRETQSITLRGQGATFQAAPAVPIYLNEVPLLGAITLSQQGGPGNFVDLESLQVLAGPQGTLFGRNSTGGALLLVPKKPRDEFGGWAKAEYGNYDRTYLEGAVNVPIVGDELMVRAVGAMHKRDGYTRDVVWDKFRDDEDWYSGRLGITMKPADWFENYTMLFGSKSSTNGAGLMHKGYNTDGLKLVGFCADPPASPIPFLGVPCDVYRSVTAQADALGPRQTAFSTDVFQKTSSWGLTNTTTIDLADHLTLRNIAGYQSLKIAYRYDGDATVLQQHDVDPGVLPAPGQATLPDGTPLAYFNSSLAKELPRDDYELLTEELQLQGNMLDNRFNWTVGGFYSHQNPTGPQGSAAVLYCPALFTGFCGSSTSQSSVKQASNALYAQGTIDLGVFAPGLDGLSLTAGYRHTWDEIVGSAYQFTPDAANPANVVCAATGISVPAAQGGSACEFNSVLKTSADTWLVGLDYKVTDDILVFGKASRGYKSGGFNPYAVFVDTRTFEPEFVTTYEVGIKADFELGTVPLRFNASAYHTKFKGIQRAAGDFNPSTNAGGAKTLNADARIRGIEIEASVRPFSGFTIGGNLSLTDADYTEYTYLVNSPAGQFDCFGYVPQGGTADSSCLDMQYVADTIYSVHASYDVTLPGNAGELAFFVNYSHTSEQNTEAVNIPAVQPGSVLEPFGLLSASIDWRNVAGSNFDVGVFGTNITNELYRTSNSDVYQNGALLYWATLYGEPRMYGLRLKFHFGGE